MKDLFIFLSAIVFVCTMLILIFYFCYVYENITSNYYYDFVSYDIFQNTIENYTLYPFVYEGGIKYLNAFHIHNGYTGRITSDLIKINDNIMIFYPLGWARFLFWYKRQFKNRHIKGLWDNE